MVSFVILGLSACQTSACQTHSVKGQIVNTSVLWATWTLSPLHPTLVVAQKQLQTLCKLMGMTVFQ